MRFLKENPAVNKVNNKIVPFYLSADLINGYFMLFQWFIARKFLIFKTEKVQQKNITD